jgi:ketosteroid isomerase-like protein
MGPREVFEQIQHGHLSMTIDGSLLADDMVVEWPFAAPGRRRRVVGKQEFLEAIRPETAALPFRFDELRVEAVHETADPEVIVAEWEVTGTMNGTGERRAAWFVTVLRVREGKVLLWREYQDTFAIAQAMAGAAGSMTAS